VTVPVPLIEKKIPADCPFVLLSGQNSSQIMRPSKQG